MQQYKLSHQTAELMQQLATAEELIRNMNSYSIRSAMPMPARRLLISGKWYLRRLPCVLQYHASLLKQAPVAKQAELLPAPKRPDIYWTELKNIKLHGSLDYPPPGLFCQGGDWDIHSVYALPSIYESIPEGTKKWDLHETVRAVFLYNQHYSKTPQYQAMMLAVEQKSPNPPQGCRTAEEVDQYFHRLIAAFKSMQAHGYLTQQEQGKSSIGEIRLHLTRDGNLCLGTGGNHRIRMAEILGIRWVPFLLRGIHPQWVIQLCQQLSEPPHKAVHQWLKSEFYDRKPA